MKKAIILLLSAFILAGCGSKTLDTVNGGTESSSQAVSEAEKSEEDEVKCCYQQKLQEYALLLELLPLGFGHYYSGRTINFGIKLTFQLIMILYMIIFTFCCKSLTKRRKHRGYDLLSNEQNKNDYVYNNIKTNIDTSRMITNAINIFFFIILIIWQGLDIFLFGLNVYKDGNSVELKKW